MKKKFWNWVRNEDTGARTLVLNGQISDETWYGDEVTPGLFREELNAGEGDITVWINSPGGDVFAAAQIYNMLREYPDKVEVRIDGMAASAASVVAMAGDKISMSPVAMMMIHNPSTIAMGDAADFKEAIAMLQEVKESIINAYETKTLMARDKISRMMDNTTWMNAKKALELKFCDEILFAPAQLEEDGAAASAFSMKVVNSAFINKFIQAHPKPEEPENTVPADQLMKRLELLKH